MAVSSVVIQSHYYPVVNFTRYADSFEKQLRYGPKGYKAYRYVVSSDIIDHQNEIVDIQALAEVLPIMEKQGARIQGMHSSYPAGEFFDWGFCKIADKLSIWVDIEFFNDYPSQKELLEKIELPSGHPDRMNGLSLGGKSLKSKRICDQDKCWTHIVELEGWEISIVKEGANEYSRQILEDTNTLEGLNLSVEYLNKEKEPTEEKTLLNRIRDVSGKFQKETPPKKEPNDTKPDDNKPDDNDCVDCPECPECQGEMSDGKCKKCGYSEGGNPEEEKLNDNSGEPQNTEGGKMEYAEDKMNGNGYSEDDNMSNNTQVIEQKIDTLMEALNIGKINDRFDKLEEGFDLLVKHVIGEQPPEEVIEKDGLKYQLIKEDKEDTKETEGLSDNEKLLLDAMSGMSKEVAILKSNIETPTPPQGDAQTSNPHAEDEELINKGDDIDTLFKSQTEDMVKDSGLDFDEVDYKSRQDMAVSSQMTLEDMDLFIN